MSRFVALKRLSDAVETLKDFKEVVRAQGLQHLLPLLALKQRGVNTETEARYEEQDDFDFWDTYFLVDPISDAGRYYDPFAGIRRIASHPHSNVATARKGTFVASWHAGTYRVDPDGDTMWRLAPNYVDIVRDKCLTKSGVITVAPLGDLLAWMYRGSEFPDDFTFERLRRDFKESFRLADDELAALFATASEDDAAFFKQDPISNEAILELVGGPAQPIEVKVEAAEFEVDATELASGMSLPAGVVLQAVSALRAGNHLILAGPPGTGKSTLAALIASAATKARYISTYQTITATADWTTFDTIGGYMPTETGSGLEFHEGLILRAISADGWPILDELNRANIDRAIGPLITLLGGSEQDTTVELAYRHESAAGLRQPVRIRRDVASSRSGLDEESGDYVIGSHWRLIATLNTFDRSNLFPLTAAFARRFATVYVGIPAPESALDVLQITEETARRVYRVVMTETFEDGWQNPRPLGPAIAKDAWRYLSKRIADGASKVSATEESVYLFVLPQYSGLDRPSWERLRDLLVDALAQSIEPAARSSYESQARRNLTTLFRGIQGEQ